MAQQENPRNRLKRKDRDLIVSGLRSLGLYAVYGGDKIRAWLPGDSDHNSKDYAVIFRWGGLRLGWQMAVFQPGLYTREDLSTALTEIQTTLEFTKRARDAWRKFAKGKSNRRWREYQGVMASFFARMGLPLCCEKSSMTEEVNNVVDPVEDDEDDIEV